MKAIASALAFAAVAAIPGPSSGQAAPAEQLVGYGVGMRSCGSYLARRRVVDRAFDDEVVYWTQGFLSAHNWYQASNIQFNNQSLDDGAVLAYLDKFCREKPLSSLVFAVDDMVHRHTGRKRGPGRQVEPNP